MVILSGRRPDGGRCECTISRMRGRRGWMPAKFAARRWIALPLVLLGTLVTAASAQGALNLQNPVAAPADTNAGHHSNFNLSFNIAGTDHIKNLVTELPAGLVGNPQAAGFCVPV